MYFENVVIGNPIVEPESIFAKDLDDWEKVEKEKTFYTNERFLPKILVEIGVAPSANEIRRNRKDLVKTLNELEYLEIKYGKKKIFILVGK